MKILKHIAYGNQGALSFFKPRPCNLISEILIMEIGRGTNAHMNPGVSYSLNGLSKKERFDQANLILSQLSIPGVSTQEIKTVHQYVKVLTVTTLGHGCTSEASTDLLSLLAKDVVSKRFMNAQVPSKPFSKMTPRLLSQVVWASLPRFTCPRIRISSQRFRYTHPNSTGKIRSTSSS